MARTLAIVFGVVFVLVALLGFINSGITGENGIFQTDTLHDIVHLLFGVILLVVAFTAPLRSASWLTIIGVIYLVLAVLGFLLVGMESGKLLGLVLMNGADHVLHVVLGVVLILAGRAGNGRTTTGSMPMSGPAM